MRRVMIIGLDGATFTSLRGWMAEGALPCLARLRANGVSGELFSVYPPVTAPAWTSLATGKNPGKHNVFDFFEPLAGAYAKQIPATAHSIKAETLWSLLSHAGQKIILVNVPMTYPPPMLNGVVIAGGILTPSIESTFTFPPDLYATLRPRLGEYVLSVPWREYSERQVGRFLQDLTYATIQQARYLAFLMENHEWDFLMTVFSGTDFIQHALWNSMGCDPQGHVGSGHEVQVLDYFRLLDDICADLISRAGSDTLVLVVSDHGFGPLRKRVHINAWLREQGLLAVQSNLFRQHLFINRLKKGLHRPFEALGLRQYFRNRGKKRVPSDQLTRLIDWSRTRAFACSPSEQGIYVNLAGRQPQGIVVPSQYEDVREQIITALQQLRDPDNGQPLISEIYRREEIYNGPFVASAPDVVFGLKDGEYVGVPLFSDGLFSDPLWQFGTGTHRMQGIFFAHGPGVLPQATITGARLIDVAPTVLYALGHAIPEDMDGRILTDIFTKQFSSSQPITFAPARDLSNDTEGGGIAAEESRQIEERLRGLGYLE